jgi:hypothetical protein
LIGKGFDFRIKDKLRVDPSASLASFCGYQNDRGYNYRENEASSDYETKEVKAHYAPDACNSFNVRYLNFKGFRLALINLLITHSKREEDLHLLRSVHFPFKTSSSFLVFNSSFIKAERSSCSYSNTAV